MSFPFTATAPAANMPPAQSQPLMQQNFNSTESILAVDHVTFGNATGGQHKQTTFVGLATPTAPMSEASVSYPATGIADAGIPQYYFQNSQATFPLSAIKAFAVFASLNVSGPISLLNGYNIQSINNSSGTYTITLSSNTTFGNNVAVFINANSSASMGNYTFSSGSLSFAFGTNGVLISVLILQI